MILGARRTLRCKLYRETRNTEKFSQARISGGMVLVKERANQPELGAPPTTLKGP